MRERLEIIAYRINEQDKAITVINKNLEKIKEVVVDMPSTIKRLMPSNDVKVNTKGIEDKLDAILTIIGKTPMETDKTPKKSEAIERLNTLVQSTYQIYNKLKDLEQIVDGNNLLVKTNTQKILNLEEQITKELSSQINSIEKGNLKMDNLDSKMLKNLEDGLERIQRQIQTSPSGTEKPISESISNHFIIYDPPQSFAE